MCAYACGLGSGKELQEQLALHACFCETRSLVISAWLLSTLPRALGWVWDFKNPHGTLGCESLPLLGSYLTLGPFVSLTS